MILLVHFYVDHNLAAAPRAGRCAEIWWTNPRNLCLPGHARLWLRARYARRQFFKFEGSPGDIAQVTVGPAARCLVLVLEEKRLLDRGRLAADFDMNFWWHLPCGERYPHGCYHILRLGHRIRFLCPPETPAEAGGSYMHILHRKMGQTTFQRLRHRLFIKEAGLRCVGSSRDEAIVATITEALLRAGKNPFVRRGLQTLSHCVRSVRGQGSAEKWHLSANLEEELLDGTVDLDPFVATKERIRRREDRGREDPHDHDLH